MTLPINTRADIDAIAGTPEHAAFMAMLAGSLWRLAKDDVQQAWVSVADDSVVARFGFTRADFPDATPPELPDYVPLAAEKIPAVPMRAFRKALVQVGLRQAVEDYVAAASIEVRDDWATAPTVARDYPLIVAAGLALGQDDAAMDALFGLARQIEATL